ncbi:DUF6680 family protein [Candidatus Nitrospira neomarina]|uniref:DUF6680 domain-containing protein n=1 Tax=Candidatus Nitrospira neomarina TaxID=3020899 RepID=A0AA96JVK2_9BACT|nr:DUF6680 family protein [Candidatus Nitrospira neomarina]WNM61170.1 hypothetical protein PQG83_15605 [Candidatus Nitrospira neomarina]
MDGTTIATIFAIIIGPLIGVALARYLTSLEDTKQRRMEIFRTLMRTRGLVISYDHVGALNLVEVEFTDEGKVIAAWKGYLKELSTPFPPTKEERAFQQKQETFRKLLTKLLHEIAKVLNIKMEQLDIFESNYIPQGWHDDDLQQRYLRTLAINLLSGRNPLPISIPSAPNQAEEFSPFPPPPESKGGDTCKENS